MSSESAGAFSLTKDTRIAIGLVGAIFVTGIGSTLAISQYLTSITTKLSLIEAAMSTSDTRTNERIDLNIKRIETIEATRYTLSMASESALRLAIVNPTMRIPDPRDPSKILGVAAEPSK